MLEADKMMDGILMATSIYFAAALKDRLVAYKENTWTLIMLVSVLACWLKADHFYSKWFKHKEETGTVHMSDEVVRETIYVVSQTLNFLVVQFCITTIDGLISEQHFFLESAVLPALMLLFCIFLVTVTKKLQKRYQK